MRTVTLLLAVCLVLATFAAARIQKFDAESDKFNNPMKKWATGLQKKQANIYNKKQQKKQQNQEESDRFNIDGILNTIKKADQIRRIIKNEEAEQIESRSDKFNNPAKKWATGFQKKQANIYNKKQQQKEVEEESDFKIKLDEILNTIKKADEIRKVIKGEQEVYNVVEG